MKKQVKTKKDKAVTEKPTGTDNSLRGLGKRSKLFLDQTDRNEDLGNKTEINFDKAV